MFAGRALTNKPLDFPRLSALRMPSLHFGLLLGTAKSNVLTFAGELILTSQSIPMDNTFDKTAVEIIDLLEARLKRIEYAVRGHVGDAGIPSNKPSASKRLADLEHSLHQLASKSRVVQDLLRLRESPWVEFQTSG